MSAAKAISDLVELLPKKTPVEQQPADLDPAEPVRARFINREDGTPIKCVANVLSILTLDRRWYGLPAYNEFLEAPVLLRQPPQREQDTVRIVPGSAWAPQDATRAAAWIHHEYDLGIASSVVTEAFLSVSQQRTVHPVREYLDGLRWDGAARVDKFFSAYCGTPNSVYVRGVARLLFLPAIARVRKPGAKVDTIVIFEGPQGGLKSSTLRALAGEQWFADTPIPLGDKDAYQCLRGVWIYELAELAALKGRDATRIKSFASSPTDHYRPSYEPRARSVPRQCIFIGTTNEAHYLADATGARRFWPVRIERVDIDAIRRDRDQLWAEADALYRAGTPWWPDPTLATLGAYAQEQRYEGDPWEEPLSGWLRRHEADPSAERGIGFTMAEILALGVNVPVEKQSKNDQERATKILHRAKWWRGKQQRENGDRVRRWFPGDAGDGPGDGTGDA